MKNILTEALVNSVTNASFICSYTNSAKLRFKPTVNVLPFAPDDPLAQPVIIAAAIHTAPAFFK